MGLGAPTAHLGCEATERSTKIAASVLCLEQPRRDGTSPEQPAQSINLLPIDLVPFELCGKHGEQQPPGPDSVRQVSRLARRKE